MENLKNILSAHYEKVILGLVLLGLGAAVVILMQASAEEQQKIDEYINQVEQRSGARVKPVDMASLEAEAKKAQGAPALELAGSHNLFNPVKWQRAPDGRWIKRVEGTEGTLDELEVLRIAPLLFSITLDKYTGSGYTIVVTNEAALPPYPKRLSQYFILNDTNKPLLILREIKGATPENPELVVELKESGERVEISRERPIVRTNTFETDLRWKVENRTFNRQRTNSVLNLGGELYKIVAINPGEIVMSASNDKKYTVRAPSAQ